MVYTWTNKKKMSGIPEISLKKWKKKMKKSSLLKKEVACLLKIYNINKITPKNN